MKKAELVFIPLPGLSHLVSTVETAKLLLDRDERISITVLVMKLRPDTVLDNYTQKISSNSSRFKFVNLPNPELNSNEAPNSTKNTFFDIINNQITPIREIISNLIEKAESQLAGLVLDMFCTKFIEVAVEFNIPSYVFFTSGACALGLFFYLVKLKFEKNEELTQYKDPEAELPIPCFSIPVPVKVLPAVFVEEGPTANIFLNQFKRIQETKGIMVNTFYELEPYAIESLSDGNIPKVYPVGPILNSDDSSEKSDSGYVIMKWLDDQPEGSVVFLCFGSMGSFEDSQVKEIASALENSGHRFLWSLRKPAEKGNIMKLPTDYENLGEVLPQGFSERTQGIGKVIGWAPQMAVLSHPAVGGFVSHCGWNSTLESVWCGVPIATFPLYAEQQLNAFELVKELGMAEEIRIDYKKDMKGEKPSEIVKSEKIEAAIRRLMVVDEDGDNQVRQKVKEMKNKSRMALREGGSSFNAQSLFIEDVIKNIA